MSRTVSGLLKWAACLIAALSIGGCGGPDAVSRSVERLIGSELNTRLDIDTADGHYTVLRYVKPLSCTSCQLQMGVWKIYKRKMANRFGDRVDIRFIVEAPSSEKVKNVVRVYGFEPDTYVDSVGLFLQDNVDFKALGNDVVVLLDSAKTIRFIGDPCQSHKADSIYNEIISRRL